MRVTCSILIGRNKMCCAVVQADSGGPFSAEASINVGFVVDKVAVGQLFIRVIMFALPISFQ
jgi:hypothetical protein